MIKEPKGLCENCLELVVCIRFNNANDIYNLDRNLPKIAISGETLGISQFYNLDWFKWVMFWDEMVPFLDDVLKLGH